MFGFCRSAIRAWLQCLRFECLSSVLRSAPSEQRPNHGCEATRWNDGWPILGRTARTVSRRVWSVLANLSQLTYQRERNRESENFHDLRRRQTGCRGSGVNQPCNKPHHGRSGVPRVRLCVVRPTAKFSQRAVLRSKRHDQARMNCMKGTPHTPASAPYRAIWTSSISTSARSIPLTLLHMADVLSGSTARWRAIGYAAQN